MSTWQHGLRGNGLKASEGLGNHGNHGTNKRSAKGRSALGDISNRSYEHGGLGGGVGPKAKKSGVLKPSFSIGADARQQVVKENVEMDTSVMEEDDFAAGVASSQESASSSVHQQPLPAIDPSDLNDQYNPKYAAEYVGPIYEHLRSVETKYMPSVSYMDTQTDINVKMRALLVDWLVQVHVKFELLPQTLYLTINILDRFLAAKLVPRKKLQLVGCAAMLAASKYEEIYAPECADFVSMSDNAFTVDDLLKMESTMLNVLGFHLTTPSPYTFLRRYMKVACSSAKTQHFATFLVERSLQEYEMLCFQPSLLAASALYIAQLHTDERRSWGSTLQRHTLYTLPDLDMCVEAIKRLYCTNQKNYLQAVSKKYSSLKYMSVSHIAIACTPLPSSTMRN